MLFGLSAQAQLIIGYVLLVFESILNVIRRLLMFYQAYIGTKPGQNNVSIKATGLSILAGLARMVTYPFLVPGISGWVYAAIAVVGVLADILTIFIIFTKFMGADKPNGPAELIEFVVEQ